MVTGASIARGAAPLMVTLGGSTKLVDLQYALNRDGDGPTQQLGGRDHQNQAGQHKRRRPAIRHQQITAGHKPLGNGLSALQRV